ncbi:MAG: hypothetical protein AAFN77_02530 [Planctomycetota bacterium]
MTPTLQRRLIGLFAVIALIIGCSLMFQPGSSQQFWSGSLIRVGCLLAVIWLAFSQLMDLKARLPAILIAIVLVCILIVAARPNFGRVLITLTIAAVAISSGIRWLSKFSKPPGTPPRV